MKQQQTERESCTNVRGMKTWLCPWQRALTAAALLSVPVRLLLKV